jgi:drug/metabolite transporter (DMT)-like permease
LGGSRSGGKRLVANLCVLLAAVLFGAATPATRVAVQDVPPLALAELRYGLGALLLCAALLAAPKFLRVRPRDLPFLLLLGGILYALFPITYNAGLRLNEASRGALILATFPLWSAVLGAVTGRERLGPRQVVGVLLTVAGVGVVVAERGLDWESLSGTLPGDALMLLTALAGAS